MITASFKKRFTPVKVELIFNNQDDLDMFASMCNSSNVTTVFPSLSNLVDTFHEAGGDITKYTSKMLDMRR
jgi:hypothetical protein